MDSFFKLFNACDPTVTAFYDRRRIGRDDVNGLTVLTCRTNDQGYKTALIDSLKPHVVERYKDRDDAIIGHQQWCVRAETIEQVISLGYDDTIPDKEVVVVRNQMNYSDIGNKDELDCE